MSAGRFHIRAGYVERDRPEYAVDEDVSNYQPDVYALAAALATMLHSRTIVDIGCGKASRLAPLHPRFGIVGIDYGSNLAWARERYPFGTWVEADLERVEPGLVGEALLAGSVLVCADVVEHLVDPTKLLATLVTWLAHAPVAVLSTPERDLWAEYGRRNGVVVPDGPPSNAAHVREWNLSEFVNYLKASGLPVAFYGLTRSVGHSSACYTILVLLQGRAEGGPVLGG